MIVNPILVGVVLTLLVELLFFLVFAIQATLRYRAHTHTASYELSKEQFERLTDMMQEGFDEPDNNNQGE